MKLKDGFLIHEVGADHMVIATGAAGEVFNGIIRNNDTANFVFERLMKETTEEEIINAMLAEYDVSKEIVTADVRELIEEIRKAGFLDE